MGELQRNAIGAGWDCRGLEKSGNLSAQDLQRTAEEQSAAEELRRCCNGAGVEH